MTDGGRIAVVGGADAGYRVTVPIEKAEDQHREDRTDGAEGNQTEAVRLRAFIASDVGDTDAHGEDERHGHRTGRHTAGVKCDAQKVAVGKRRKRKNQCIKTDQQPAQARTGDDAQHTDRHEKADADTDGHKQNDVFDVRHGLRKYLQVRFRNGDGKAEQKADAENQRQILRLGQRRADFVADRRHGLLRAERE